MKQPWEKKISIKGSTFSLFLKEQKLLITMENQEKKNFFLKVKSWSTVHNEEVNSEHRQIEIQ